MTKPTREVEPVSTTTRPGRTELHVFLKTEKTAKWQQSLNTSSVATRVATELEFKLCCHLAVFSVFKNTYDYLRFPPHSARVAPPISPYQLVHAPVQPDIDHGSSLILVRYHVFLVLFYHL
jgi:hypothetical protein